MPETVNGQIAPAPRPTQAPGCPKLTEALAAARDRCKGAARDGHNPHHGYRYATADNVIDTASEALAGSGLALLPAGQRLNVLGTPPQCMYTLDRTILLSHSSGEFLPLVVEGWPVIPDRGRPLDKAYASALTASLAYLLRDLLQMPRGIDHDIAARDDREAEPVPAALREAAGRQADSIPDTAQVDRISALVERLRLPWMRGQDRLVQKYGVESVAKLSKAQADEVEQALVGRKPVPHMILPSEVRTS